MHKKKKSDKRLFQDFGGRNKKDEMYQVPKIYRTSIRLSIIFPKSRRGIKRSYEKQTSKDSFNYIAMVLYFYHSKKL